MKYTIADIIGGLFLCVIFVYLGLNVPRHLFHTEICWAASSALLIAFGIKQIVDVTWVKLLDKLFYKPSPPTTTKDRLPFAHVAQKKSYAVINGMATLITRETINTDRGKLSHKGSLSIVKGDDCELRIVFEDGNIIKSKNL